MFCGAQGGPVGGEVKAPAMELPTWGSPTVVFGFWEWECCQGDAKETFRPFLVIGPGADRPGLTVVLQKCVSQALWFPDFTRLALARTAPPLDLSSDPCMFGKNFLEATLGGAEGLLEVVRKDDRASPQAGPVLLPLSISYDTHTRHARTNAHSMFDCFSAATAALTLSLFPFQNPREADPMTKVQAELDETKIILVSEAEGAQEAEEDLLGPSTQSLPAHEASP